MTTQYYKENNNLSDEELTTLVEQFSAMKVELQPLLDQFKTLENKIKDEVVNRGETFNCEHGSVSFRKAYERVSWDSKGLQGYAVHDPNILKFQKISTVNAGASIKVK